jgi:uncharacterized protein YeaO (DUF488 family)
MEYESPEASDGSRAGVDVWLKDIARASAQNLTDLVLVGKVTLRVGAHDTERNYAVALADYLATH